jgi:RimJ/RimL family protein N-acetyltransferase
MGPRVPDGIQIRPIRPADLPAYKALRLEALQSHPEAFGSDHSEQVNEPDSFWESRIRSSLDGVASRIIVAADDSAGQLAGMAGAFRDEGIKTRHSATLVAVYVAPRYRGHRLADAIIHEILAWCAAAEIRILRLAVATTNVPAIRCYHRCGFQICGLQPDVIRVADTYHDELLMWRRV